MFLIGGRLSRSLPESPETIEFEVRTTSANGLIFWQGVVSGQEMAGMGGTGGRGQSGGPMGSGLGKVVQVTPGGLV